MRSRCVEDEVGERHEPADVGTAKQEHSKRHSKMITHFEVDAFWQAQPMKSCNLIMGEGATKSKHQTRSCDVEDQLEASLQVS